MKNNITTSLLVTLFLLVISSISNAGLINTDATGGGASHENKMPSLAVGYYVQTHGTFEHGIGRVRMFAGSPPSGWAKADGNLIPISGNEALFSTIGITYGGDGETTFALPDLRNGAVVHEGNGPGLTPWRLGQSKGSNTETLSLSQIPSHDHPLLSSTDTTTATGGTQAHNNIQKSTAIRYGIATQGTFPSESLTANISSSETPFLGEIRAFSGPVPTGFQELDGQIIPIGLNPALFSLLGTTYGGDGETTFALPDMRGRVGVHAGIFGSGPGLPPVVLGQRGGVEQVTLTEANLPSHSHTYATTLTTDTTGGSSAHENRQPYLAINYALALTGVFPSGDAPLTDETEAYRGEIVMFAGNFAPTGTAFLNGQLLPIASYTSLFSLLGTIYGGDGETNFALPDLRGRTPVQAFSEFALGELFGANQVTISVDTMASHIHQVEVIEEVSEAVPIPAPFALLGLGLAVIGLTYKSRH